MKVFTCSIFALVLVNAVPINGQSYRETRYNLNPSALDRWNRHQRTITIRLHDTLVELCGGHPQSCSTSPDAAKRDIQRAVMTALADFNKAGANVRFQVSGWTSSAASRSDTIVLAHYNAVFDGPCDIGRAFADHRQVYVANLGLRSSGQVLFCTRIAPSQAVHWTPWHETFGSGDVVGAFIPAAKHEILHVLGLRHPDPARQDEDARNATVMRSAGFVFKHLAREDIRFLRDHFGARATEGQMNVSANGVTWGPAGSAAPPEASRAIGPPAAASSGEGRHLFLAWRGPSEDRIAVTRLTSTNVWSTMAAVAARNAPYPPGIASMDHSRLVLAYQRHGAGLSSASLQPIVRASNDGGVTWTSEFPLERSTAVPGVSATHDPATGEWLVFTTGLAVNGRARRLRYYSLGVGDAPDELPASFVTADVPSVACAPPAQTGAYNCLVAWQSDAWAPIVHWTQCRVVTPYVRDLKLDCLPRASHGYLTVGSPSVTYTGASGAYPWQIALSQGGSAIYTWRKAGSPAVNWVDQRSFSYPPDAGIPALGSQLRSGANRVFLAALTMK